MSKKFCTRSSISEYVTEDTAENVKFESGLSKLRHTDSDNSETKPQPNCNYSVKSLMHHCVLYIAKNAHFVESFWGFPDIVGERIFKTALELGTFTNAKANHARALTAFNDAYGSMVLETLTLSYQYLALNNNLECIFLFTELTKLDISCCGIGDSHEILHHISQLHSLTTLSVRGNALSDDGLRKLTAPVRMFKQGLQTLKYLDLSENKLTDKGLQHLTCFSNIEIVNLSSNKIENYRKLKVKRFYLSTKASTVCRDVFVIDTTGWAAPLISLWCQEQAARTKTTKVRKSTFYGNSHISVQPNIQFSAPIYSHVLVSDRYLKQLPSEKSNNFNNSGIKNADPLSKSVEKENICATSLLKNVEHGKHAGDNEVRTEDKTDEGLMKMYGGYSSVCLDAPTLSAVLSKTW